MPFNTGQASARSGGACPRGSGGAPLELELPYNFAPRPYQLPILRALDGGAKRAVAVWHRRAGKEKTFLNYTVKCTSDRVGTYFYFFPTYAQAKKAIWDGLDRSGFPFMSHFPDAWIAKKNEQELKVECINGSVFQLIGSDNFNSIMSTNPVGCVFAEYALQDPRAWDYIRPILRENDGWAIFDFTPRGKNHGYLLYEMAKKLHADGDKRWFAQRLTVEDTGVITPAMIQDERREGMSDEMIAQEFYCSFEGVQEGAYYGREMAEVAQAGRICSVPYYQELPVHTWWDLGISDATAIWFTQDVGRELHVIDYYENAGEGLLHYARVLRERNYLYGSHNAPHDIEVRELGSGKSRLETAAELGIRFNIVPKIGVQDGIDAVRVLLSRCWFDTKATETGRLALVSYHKAWDEKRRTFLSHPYHDWSSHASDSFRYLAVGHKLARPTARQRPQLRLVSRSEAGTDWMAA